MTPICLHRLVFISFLKLFALLTAQWTFLKTGLSLFNEIPQGPGSRSEQSRGCGDLSFGQDSSAGSYMPQALSLPFPSPTHYEPAVSISPFNSSCMWLWTLLHLLEFKLLHPKPEEFEGKSCAQMCNKIYLRCSSEEEPQQCGRSYSEKDLAKWENFLYK